MLREGVMSLMCFICAYEKAAKLLRQPITNTHSRIHLKEVMGERFPPSPLLSAGSPRFQTWEECGNLICYIVKVVFGLGMEVVKTVTLSLSQQRLSVKQ
jgi:hypothetical protein